MGALVQMLVGAEGQQESVMTAESNMTDEKVPGSLKIMRTASACVLHAVFHCNWQLQTT